MSESREERERLATNTNETTTSDDDVEAHGVDGQSNETVVEDAPDVEAHGVDGQSNETVVEDEG